MLFCEEVVKEGRAEAADVHKTCRRGSVAHSHCELVASKVGESCRLCSAA